MKLVDANKRSTITTITFKYYAYGEPAGGVSKNRSCTQHAFAENLHNCWSAVRGQSLASRRVARDVLSSYTITYTNVTLPGSIV